MKPFGYANCRHAFFIRLYICLGAFGGFVLKNGQKMICEAEARDKKHVGLFARMSFPKTIGTVLTLNFDLILGFGWSNPAEI